MRAKAYQHTAHWQGQCLRSCTLLAAPTCEQASGLLFAGQLNSLGVIKYFADVVGGKLVAMKLSWQAVFGLLNVAYFALHYMFASQTAHVGALYSAFLAMMLTAGVQLVFLWWPCPAPLHPRHS